MTLLLTPIHSASVDHIKPILSVLIPYYHDDPMALVMSLSAQMRGHAVEIILYDDGSAQPDINTPLTRYIQMADSPISLWVAAQNKGRSFARNTLTQKAQADYILFLDADMRPVTDHFLSDYVALIKADCADIIFGGFTVPHRADTPDRDLHRALSETSDCLTLAQRQDAGPQYVATSNLCVKKTVFETEPFDAGFQGWGWEDSEWAARVNHSFRLKHADIPALHLGLETTDTLLSRFATSADNYVRFTERHPDLAKQLTLYSASQTLRRLPGQTLLRPLLKGIVKTTAMPMRLRLMALKLWRASWYAEAFS